MVSSIVYRPSLSYLCIHPTHLFTVCNHRCYPLQPLSPAPTPNLNHWLPQREVPERPPCQSPAVNPKSQKCQPLLSNKKPSKTIPKTHRERQHSNSPMYLCVLLFEPQALCKVIDLSSQHRVVAAELYYALLRTTQALEVTHIVLLDVKLFMKS